MAQVEVTDAARERRNGYRVAVTRGERNGR
ncbi:hypothetical protein BVIR_1852 [Blastochloris viridis]|uniref:Uncharacterized protein n=1 Tax=Blastochloris viridis TaxID=1079 RepID=A0A0P0J737_BLAVI|nr:hypothetical protein BVIR_1852 [Blastochloris viridis]CUU42289.1 hypothetical protein BVIRIDIS_12970 [Blastochloris viridis]